MSAPTIIYIYIYPILSPRAVMSSFCIWLNLCITAPRFPLHHHVSSSIIIIVSDRSSGNGDAVTPKSLLSTHPQLSSPTRSFLACFVPFSQPPPVHPPTLSLSLSGHNDYGAHINAIINMWRHAGHRKSGARKRESQNDGSALCINANEIDEAQRIVTYCSLGGIMCSKLIGSGR